MRQAATQPDAGDHAGGDAEQHDGHHQLGVVHADIGIAVTEGLERGDLLALGADQSRDHHIEQKRRHAEEDHREGAAHLFELFELFGQKPVRGLIDAPVSTETAITFQHRVELVDDVVFARAAGECERDIVEGAVHVVGRRQRIVRHPQHAEAREVREDRMRRDLIDEFRRQRDADDGELFALAVDDHAEAVAGLETVRLGEGIADDDFVGAIRIQQSSGAQIQTIEIGASFTRR